MSIPVLVVRGHDTPLGYQQIKNLAAATGLEPKGALVALIQAETKDVRWRDDGVAPTAGVGMILAAGSVMEYRGDMNALRFIETAASATLNVVYYGPEV
jgi:hypothetical protein